MLGLVTIGQSPRDDVVRAMFGERMPEIVQRGALDEMDSETISSLAPQPGESVLVSRLANGRSVELSKERLLPYLQRAVDHVEEAEATMICILCTGAFPSIKSSVNIVMPDALIRAVIDVVLPSGTLGVLMPHPEQAEMMQRKWASTDRKVVTASASPYESSRSGIPTAAAQLVQQDVDLIIMDCMGFDRRMHAVVSRFADCPVVLSNGLVGAVLKEMMLALDPDLLLSGG